MISAKTFCPKSWTLEHYGDIMTEHHGDQRNSVYECVDKDADFILDSQKNTDSALYRSNLQLWSSMSSLHTQSITKLMTWNKSNKSLLLAK